MGHHSRNDLAEENLVLGPYKIIDNGDSDDVIDYRGENGKGMLVYRLLGTFDVWEH